MDQMIEWLTDKLCSMPLLGSHLYEGIIIIIIIIVIIIITDIIIIIIIILLLLLLLLLLLFDQASYIKGLKADADLLRQCTHIDTHPKDRPQSLKLCGFLNLPQIFLMCTGLWDEAYCLSSLSEKTRNSNLLQISLQRQQFLLRSFNWDL